MKMKIFQCQKCHQTVFFENTHCESCQSELGFLAAEMRIITLKTDAQKLIAYADSTQQFKYCQNFHEGGCNWLLSADSGDKLCLACDLNKKIPDLGVERHRQEWIKIEIAKHRLVYELLLLGLPVVSKRLDPLSGLAFNFLSDDLMETGEQVMTGHMQGLITLNTEEANPVQREKMKAQMAEPYRTLIGHFRHEIGHHYWNVLISDNNRRLEAYRTLFGDERQDYQEALESHYEAGPPATWREHFVSAYASCHPWEDWAETWAHYMHLISTLHTAQAYGLRLQPQVDGAAPQVPPMDLSLGYNLLAEGDMNIILSDWLKLTLAVNSLNRSMGQPDLYPFVLAPRVREKLGFVHQLIIEQRNKAL